MNEDRRGEAHEEVPILLKKRGPHFGPEFFQQSAQREI